MPATGYDFPKLTPSSRRYIPGTYPTSEFQGLNGAVTSIQYGNLPVDSSLEMTFTNITDDEASAIFENYRDVMSNRDEDTGRCSWVDLTTAQPALAGMTNNALKIDVAQKVNEYLRYRYAEPPQITSVFPGRSTVSIKLRGYLEGADSTK